MTTSITGQQYLTTVFEIFINITLYTVLLCTCISFIAGCYAVYIHVLHTYTYSHILLSKLIDNTNNGDKNVNKFNKAYIFYIPILSILFGSITSVIQCILSSIMIALICATINYTMNNNIAIGIGVIQGVIVLYIQCGGIKYMHR